MSKSEGSNREFPLAVVVSVVKNRLVAPFDEYRAFLDHLVGQPVPLWDVARARLAAATYLTGRDRKLNKMPEPPEKTDSGNASRYVKTCAKKLGTDTLTIPSAKVDFTVRTAGQAAP